MYVIKRSGHKQALDIQKIRKVISFAVEGLNANEEELEMDAKIQFTDGIKTEDIQKLLIKTASEKVSSHEPDWTYVAGRLLLYDLYKKVSHKRNYRIKEKPNGKFYPYYKKGFYDLIKYGIDNGLYGAYLLNFYKKEDIDKLGHHIKPERDLNFTYTGLKILSDRYLVKDTDGQIIELPQEMYMLIAMTLALPEKDENRIKYVMQFYDVLSKHEITVATPTLMNARRPFTQLSSCFVLSIDDDLYDMFHNLQNMAQISKFAGGLGVYIGKIRATGSPIRGVKGASSGVIPYVKLINDTMVYVNQLGMRKGSASVTLDVWHKDILEFLEVKTNAGDERKKAHDIHPAVSIPDIFMKRVQNNEKWTLICPSIGQKVVLDYLIDKYISSLYKNVQVSINKLKNRKDIVEIIVTGELAKKDVDKLIEDIKENIIGSEWIVDEDLITDNSLSSSEVDKDTKFKYELTCLWKKGLEDLYGEEFELCYEYIEGLIEKGKINEVYYKEVNAFDLWKRILTVAFETGEPYIFFRDVGNKTNPNKHTGVVYSSNLCVTGDTRLATQFGLVKAKELYEMGEDLIVSYDLRTDGKWDNYGVGIAKALKMYKTLNKADVYRVVTKDGYEIKATDYHDFYVAEPKDLQKKKYPCSFNIVKKKLKDLKIGDYLLIQSGEGQFGKEGSYELGLLMGLVTADGLINDKQAIIDLWNDRIIYERQVSEAIIKVIDEHRDRIDINGSFEMKLEGRKEVITSENGRKIRINSVLLKRVFDLYGFTKETKLQVPEVVFKGNKNMVKGYLQGLFSCDGCVEVIKNDGVPSFAIQLSSISYDLLKDVQILLSNFGIKCHIYDRDTEGVVSFTYITKEGEYREYKSKKSYRLDICGNNAIKFVKEIGFLDEKQEKALAVLYERYKALGREESRKKERFLSKIVKIEYVGKEDVYDTTQLYNHSLIFNGIVTGNCMEIAQSQRLAKHYRFDLNNIWELPPNIVQSYRDYTNNINTLQTIKNTHLSSLIPVCNLGSINLGKICSKEDFERVIPILVRILDNVIELNAYPIKDTEISNKLMRAIGIGVSNYHYCLVKHGIKWESEDHIRFADKIFEQIAYYTIKASNELAKERDKYPLFEGSDWSKGIFFGRDIEEIEKDSQENDNNFNWKELAESVIKNGLRNGYMLALMPTGSTSLILGATPSIDPIFAKYYKEENMSGVLPQVPPEIDKFFWHYKTAYTIDHIWTVKAGARRQKWIDQAQSLNIFIDPQNIDGKKLSEIYMTAWKEGLKTIYYLRSKSISDTVEECESCSV